MGLRPLWHSPVPVGTPSALHYSDETPSRAASPGPPLIPPIPSPWLIPESQQPPPGCWLPLFPRRLQRCPWHDLLKSGFEPPLPLATRAGRHQPSRPREPHLVGLVKDVARWTRTPSTF